MNAPPAVAQFDSHANDYDRSLHQGLALTGEDKDYFAHGRVRWLGNRLRQAGARVTRVLDYGCGIGSSTPWLLRQFQPERLLGVDISDESLARAAASFGSATVAFQCLGASRPQEEFDLAFCNGVFHHIPPGNRLEALSYIYRALCPGGWFALWENNPWNPGTRYVMSRIPFDREAVPLSARAARVLLETADFEVVRTDFLFIFPRVLRWLRGMEPGLCSLPLGGQYQVLCRKRKPQQG